MPLYGLGLTCGSGSRVLKESYLRLNGVILPAFGMACVEPSGFLVLSLLTVDLEESATVLPHYSPCHNSAILQPRSPVLLLKALHSMGELEFPLMPCLLQGVFVFQDSELPMPVRGCMCLQRLRVQGLLAVGAFTV